MASLPAPCIPILPCALVVEGEEGEEEEDTSDVDNGKGDLRRDCASPGTFSGMDSSSTPLRLEG